MSWQIILDYPLRIDDENPTVEPDVDVYDIDMFLSQNNTVIANLHKLGKKVICYFSAGSYEPWRPDAHKFLDSDLGNTLAGWANERWLNISSPSVRAIMASRIETASKVGCDAIDPDNVDGYQNDSGLDLTAASSIQFLNFLAGLAREHNLAIGLKNSLDIIKDVLHLVQFSVNEECANYHECSAFSAFIQDNKPVFHVEYPAGAPGAISAKEQQDSCEASGATGFSTVLKTLELTSWVEYCSGQTANTSVIITTAV
ncbi:endo alpha-1,4 polygalactosaminidase precursor [Lasiosphaeria miniovina]|uniref:alpha-galactosidase n=1 Tax=Lasiosphaeria miniovina TaxID=1954250 RepID=A0AA40EAW2_9PEZI|nr:endo alpha-1,4 polygalactosaminidase precursor [Lasiosphaeria miniovina]KAK0733190.1 endo alpha-1,4 polygalactosaminidase precursor [Lasiosphaeria miniovina]